eukprot:scaffold65742_cov67-Phaeocystis_antarctica.AAC.1
MPSPAPLGKGKWYGVDRNPATGTMVAEFDCPADAWFFAGAPRDDLMPYSILMEIALQTCGILTSWNKASHLATWTEALRTRVGRYTHCGATFTTYLLWRQAPLTLAVKEGFNLLFRNLDTTATLLRT